MENKDYVAFCEFEDLGLSDYILDLNLEIKTRMFPLDRFSAGDLSKRPLVVRDFTEFKVFKNLVDNGQKMKEHMSQGLKEVSNKPTQSSFYSLFSDISVSNTQIDSGDMLNVFNAENHETTNINQSQINSSDVFNTFKAEHRRITNTNQTIVDSSDVFNAFKTENRETTNINQSQINSGDVFNAFKTEDYKTTNINQTQINSGDIFNTSMSEEQKATNIFSESTVSNSYNMDYFSSVYMNESINTAQSEFMSIITNNYTTQIQNIQNQIEEVKKIIENNLVQNNNQTSINNKDSIEFGDNNYFQNESVIEGSINQSITNLINKKIEEANTVSAEYITEIENNLQMFSSNTIEQKITNIEKHQHDIIKINKETVEETKKELEKKTDAIFKFLNS